MKIFAISDLHLSIDPTSKELYKPMSIFGDNWIDHHKRIAENWQRIVRDEDLVLIPGDHSWAISLRQVEPDLDFIGALPGQKVMIRGNHDYWWEGIGKVRKHLPKRTYALQNDALQFSGISICGTRGWITPLDEGFKPEEDGKIYEREAQRLEMSLQAAKKHNSEIVIALLHYPPSIGSNRSLFTQLLEQYQVNDCIYGHVHSEYKHYFTGLRQGVNYHLVSCDYLDFTPKLILEV